MFDITIQFRHASSGTMSAVSCDSIYRAFFLHFCAHFHAAFSRCAPRTAQPVRKSADEVVVHAVEVPPQQAAESPAMAASAALLRTSK